MSRAFGDMRFKTKKNELVPCLIVNFEDYLMTLLRVCHTLSGQI